MHPVQTVASSVLAEIIRRQPGSPARTAFAWSIAVGPAMARAASVELQGGVLIVAPRDPRWTREITRASATVLARVQALLGTAAVTSLRVLDAPAAPPPRS